MTIITRRSVFGLIAAGVCAPAIVRITSIMPIRSFAEYPLDLSLGSIGNYALDVVRSSASVKLLNRIT